MKILVPLEPAKRSIVGSDDATVGCGALSKIDIAIGPDDRSIGVMIAETRQTFR